MNCQFLKIPSFALWHFLIRKSPALKIDSNSEPEKEQALPGFWTRPGRSECSNSCATSLNPKPSKKLKKPVSASRTYFILNRYSGWSDPLSEMSCYFFYSGYFSINQNVYASSLIIGSQPNPCWKKNGEKTRKRKNRRQGWWKERLFLETIWNIWFMNARLLFFGSRHVYRKTDLSKFLA